MPRAATARTPSPSATPMTIEPTPSRSGTTVTVACKLPHGLELRNFRMVDRDIPVLGGGMRTIQEAQQTGESIKINGTAAPAGQHPPHAVVGGYALTPNVPADAFEKWMHDNRDQEVVINKLIFGAPTLELATGQAREQKKIRSGLEPIDASKDSKDLRMVKGIEPVKADD